MHSDFVALHDSYFEAIETARDHQSHDERVLQAQLVSRIAFVSSQIKDLDFATHRRIIEHGLRIGNTAAECIVDADETLQLLSAESGQEINEISAIASKDFLRIPNEFAHPLFYQTQHKSKKILKQILSMITQINPVTHLDELADYLESRHENFSNDFAQFNDDVEFDVTRQRKEMNYMKAEVFPILEYSLRYFRQGTERIIENLRDCNWTRKQINKTIKLQQTNQIDSIPLSPT